MAYSPSHRPAMSVSNGSNNLLPPAPGPTQKQQRRMTSPGSLNIPDNQSHKQPGRPPSPLRNGFIPDTSTGVVDDDDLDDEGRAEEWSRRSPSPSSSVSQFAANFAQRVGSFVGHIAPKSPGTLPSDAELEAEAEIERDRSRREAERILTLEAEERKTVEERVLAMMQNNRLPPPPARSQTLPNPPSPSASQKEGSNNWWTAAKNKLTPTKEPLTPAQQVIQEAKAREKDKKNGKGKEKEKEWPANSQDKFNDPAFLNLSTPVTPQRRPVPLSPSSPTPSRPNTATMPPNLTPSPMRAADSMSSSPSREAPPLYAQFNGQGTLDVPGTLLTIAKRFEKLEKWTVGHVRALEERMGDVERWLVDKEKEKQGKDAQEDDNIPEQVGKEMQEIKEEVAELQGRVGELGREMAKLATAPANLSSGPSRMPAQVSVAPQTTSSFAVHAESDSPLQSTNIIATNTNTTPHTRLSSGTHDSTSPPMSSSKATPRPRLPYPSGDYATPPDSVFLSQGTFSPSSSPPSSIISATRPRPISISGLPGVGLGITSSQPSSGSSGLPQTTSPHSIASVARAVSPTSLPAPKQNPLRATSISPTPRKRYTVALGGPITAPSDGSEYQRIGTPISRPASSIGTAFFTSSPWLNNGGNSVSSDDDDGNDSSNEPGHAYEEETIGKSSAAKLMSGSKKTGANTTTSSSSNPRIRAQSIYGLSSLQPQTPTSVAPLTLRTRSQSTDRFGPGATDTIGGKFVDPLLLRKQETKLAMPKPIGKVPIGQLVAFFDGDK